MTVRDLNIGDVFQMAGGSHKQLWRKVSQTHARRVGARLLSERRNLRTFGDREIDVTERAAEISRAENVLLLKGGEVTLTYHGPWRVHRCTPGDPLTEFVLSGGSFHASRAARPAEDTALAFSVATGGKHLNRPQGSDIFAYQGRVYARATNKEASSKKKTGGYRLVRNIDGVKRIVIAGLLVLPGESALYDIIMEHFGPDAAPRE